MRSLVRAYVSLACALFGACSSSGSDDAGTQLNSRTGSLALLSVERFVDDSSLPRLVAGAKVARFQGIQGESLLALLGADMRELETCGSETGLGQLALTPDARVELLSVGNIQVRLGQTVTTLSPRLFPALATTASGFFYAGDTEMVAPRAELDEYFLGAPGERGVGAFEVSAVAPSEVLGLSAEGSVDAQLTLVRGQGTAITWEPEDPRDRIELEIYSGGSVLSCACRDDGHFALTAEQLTALESDPNASVIARRVRIVPLDVQGIDSSFARVATTRTLAVSVH